MLVVVEDRDVHTLFECLLDVKTFRSLDILQIDATKSRLHKLANLDNLFRIFCPQLDIKHINIRKSLEENPLPFHDRFCRQGAQVPQAEHGGAI